MRGDTTILTPDNLGRSLALNRMLCHLSNMWVAQKLEAYIVAQRINLWRAPRGTLGMYCLWFGLRRG